MSGGGALLFSFPRLPSWGKHFHEPGGIAPHSSLTLYYYYLKFWLYCQDKNAIICNYFTFIFIITKHYFSDENIQFTNKSRSLYSLTLNKDKDNLPVLKNDTNNIIVYKNDLEEFKKKRKKRLWEKLITN